MKTFCTIARRNLFAATLLVAGLSYSAAAQAEAKIGMVDLQRAINETEDGRRAKNKLQGIFKKKQKELDSKQTELKKMKESIEKQKKVLSKAALQSKLETYQKSFVQLQTTYVEYQKELASKEGQLTKGILEQMQSILRRIGQAEGYTMIVERNEGGVVWVPSHLDLTDRLIQSYNSGKKGKKSSNKKKSKSKKKKK